MREVYSKSTSDTNTDAFVDAFYGLRSSLASIGTGIMAAISVVNTESVILPSVLGGISVLIGFDAVKDFIEAGKKLADTDDSSAHR